VVIRKGSWDMLPVFQMIRDRGGVPEAELYQVFNMGIGMTVIAEGARADAVLKACQKRHQAWIIGQVVKGKGVARVV
jgi:phosphoribosylformylglycinamidine cyclo-ligase